MRIIKIFLIHQKQLKIIIIVHKKIILFKEKKKKDLEKYYQEQVLIILNLKMISAKIKIINKLDKKKENSNY